MKKITSIVLMLVASQFNLKAQQRIIHWVHGFGANQSAWFPVVAATQFGAAGYPARNVTSNNSTYTGPSIAINSLEDAGNELSIQVKNFLAPYGGIGSPNAQNSFIIAHSQGGLVSRWSADVSIPSATTANQAQHYGGIVTFGTPHAGAQIATSRYNGTLDVFLNGACTDYTVGVISQELGNANYGFWQNLFQIPSIANIGVELFRDKLCDALFSDQLTSNPKTNEFLSQRLLGTVLSSGGQRSVIDDPILADYQIGAPRLTRLNTSTLQPMVRVNFYGTEQNSQAFLRTLHYMSKPSQSIPAFTATDDEENLTLSQLAEQRVKLENDAIRLDQEATDLSCTALQWAFLSPMCLIRQPTVNTYRTWASNMRKAVTWMDNSNAQWLSLIGARTQTVTSTRTCQCDAGAIPGSDPNRCASVNVRGGCRWVTNTVTTINDEANDGVVTRSSAIAMPGAISLSEEQMQMAGSQHMQMRNDPNLNLKLTALFRGDYHWYFITP